MTFSGPILEAATVPTADEVLQELNISDSDRQSIREGKIVKWTTSEGSDRELAIGMALLAKTKGATIVELFREASAFKVEGAITAHGKITGDGTLADFARVKLEPNGEKEAQRYLNVEPGEELNLDAKEIAAFRALKSTGGPAPCRSRRSRRRCDRPCCRGTRPIGPRDSRALRRTSEGAGVKCS